MTYPLVFKQIEELEGYLEQLKADLRVAQQRHQAAVEEVRYQLWFLPNTGFQCDFYQRASAVRLINHDLAGW